MNAIPMNIKKENINYINMQYRQIVKLFCVTLTVIVNKGHSQIATDFTVHYTMNDSSRLQQLVCHRTPYTPHYASTLTSYDSYAAVLQCVCFADSASQSILASHTL